MTSVKSFTPLLISLWSASMTSQIFVVSLFDIPLSFSPFSLRFDYVICWEWKPTPSLICRIFLLFPPSAVVNFLLLAFILVPSFSAISFWDTQRSPKRLLLFLFPAEARLAARSTEEFPPFPLIARHYTSLPMSLALSCHHFFYDIFKAIYSASYSSLNGEHDISNLHRVSFTFSSFLFSCFTRMIHAINPRQSHMLTRIVSSLQVLFNSFVQSFFYFFPLGLVAIFFYRRSYFVLSFFSLVFAIIFWIP